MVDFEQLHTEQGIRKRFHEFQNLMRYRIREVLLVSSLYDSFILEEDGQLYEKILSEYHDLNISRAPGITRVSNGEKALELVGELNRFELIITTLNLVDMPALAFAEKVREKGMDTPIVLLTYDSRELNELLRQCDTSVFENVFIWQGDFRILLAIIKTIEDKRNVDQDTNEVGVQSIIVIEDNVHFYSSYMPMIYTELFRHTATLYSEGINVPHKLLRMRARPKILLCGNYEEAWHYYKTYEECILGVISDIAFPREGKEDPTAGIRFAREVKASHFDIPILLQSDSKEYAKVAEELGVSFLLKSSPLLLHEVQRFMKNSFSFGPFVFSMPDGSKVGQAGDLRTLEDTLKTVPGESIKFHAERNHFSNWLKARTEFWLAHKLRPQRVSDYDSLEDLRRYLIASLREYRKQRERGRISDFNPDTFDPLSSFARLGGGSLGGKARGLAFTNNLINNFNLARRFEGICIKVPPSLVLGADVFDQYLDENNLRDFAIQCEDDQEILRRFREALFPEGIVGALAAYLNIIKYPLAVRSSSLLEDSRYLPFAGVYLTCMLPNSHKESAIRLESLLRAVKSVYASTFSLHAKAYLRATHYRLEEEKMAVIIQQLIGAAHGDRFYPDFAGVARSFNFYPRHPMKSQDGIVSAGLGLGKMVIEGGESIRFCPKYPAHSMQFAGMEDLLKYSQKEFFAVALDEPDVILDPENERDIVKCGLDVAERDGTLSLVGSTYSPENDAVYDGLSRNGVRLVTFAPILKGKLFPLPEIIDLIMDLGAWGMNSPVELEFAVNHSTAPGQLKEFGVLQVRPLVKSHERGEIEVEDVERYRLICESREVLGHGVIENLRDVVFVDPQTFDRARSFEGAQEVGQYNAELLSEDRPYILVGMGRWGSADTWLGIPVKWDQIAGVRVIIETGFDDFRVAPSQGTHFFQNLTSFRVGYFTINSFTKEGFLDWDWLCRQEPHTRRTFTRRLKFDRPLVVKMNAHTNKGVIFKP